jgi:uncharacterized RDD family membrane protein YckC
MTSATLLNRAIAKGIDLVLALAIAETLPRVGWVAAILYVLVADGVGGGQSLGKKLLGLIVLDKDGNPCPLKSSILRNILFGAGVFLWNIPLLGWALLAAAIIIEFLVLMGSAEGKRLGDELAGTRVFYEAGHEDEIHESGDEPDDEPNDNISSGSAEDVDDTTIDEAPDESAKEDNEEDNTEKENHT